MKSFFRPVFAISRVTFRELITDRILYNVLVIAFLLFAAGYLASQLSSFLQDRVIIDFGVAAVTLASVIIGIFSGAALITKEFERKTHMVALSRPVSSLQFILGKYLGLALILILNVGLTSLVLFLTLALTHEGFSLWSSTLSVALVFVLLQSLILAGLATMISSYSSAAVSIMMTIGLYLIGINVSTLQSLAEKNKDLPLGGLLRALSHLIPNFELFSLGTKVTYRLPITLSNVMTSIGYGSMWILLTVFIAGLLIRHREQ